MSNMRQSESFRYWKRPRHKWFVLTAAILQLLCLWMNAQEYQKIAKAGILSASEWARFAAQKILQCGFNSLTAAIFLGIFLIGALARSQRAARLAEGWLMLGLAAAWGGHGTRPSANLSGWVRDFLEPAFASITRRRRIYPLGKAKQMKRILNFDGSGSRLFQAAAFLLSI